MALSVWSLSRISTLLRVLCHLFSLFFSVVKSQMIRVSNSESKIEKHCSISFLTKNCTFIMYYVTNGMFGVRGIKISKKMGFGFHENGFWLTRDTNTKNETGFLFPVFISRFQTCPKSTVIIYMCCINMIIICLIWRGTSNSTIN